MEQVNQQISSAHNWLARIAFIFFGIMLITFFGIVYLSNKQYETPTPVTPTPIVYTTPSPTPEIIKNGMKTYKDNTYGFTFNYPANWSLTNYSFGSVSLTSPDFKANLDIGIATIASQGAMISIDVLRKQNVVASGKPIDGFPTKIIKKEPFTVNGISSQLEYFQGNNYPSYKGVMISIPQNDYIYSISMVYASRISIDIFKQVINTFAINQNMQILSQEKQQIDAWIKKNNLNDYGDPKDTVYTGGTPLFDERTGQSKDKYEYVLEKHPTRPWKISQ